MPLLEKLDFSLDADHVLRAQGADPVKLRARRPDLASISEKAIEEGRPLLDPKVLYAELKVQGLQHTRLLLEGGLSLQGELIAQHLAQAETVILLLCTVGEGLEARLSQVMAESMVYGLALDGVGSAATESLANAACNYFEQRAAETGSQITIPLSPGMIGWSVAEGQPQIFHILDSQEIGVQLTEQSIMIPRKSLTMVLGIGAEVNHGGRTCDYCNLRATCRYQDHYAAKMS